METGYKEFEPLTLLILKIFMKKAHGNLEYPVMVYFIDLYKSYMHSIRWHWHEEMEVIIVNSGKAEFNTDDETYILSPGQG